MKFAITEATDKTKVGNIRKELIEVTKLYDKNEDMNYHAENRMLLVNTFGTPQEIKKMAKLMARQDLSNANGGLDDTITEQGEMVRKYFAVLYAIAAF